MLYFGADFLVSGSSRVALALGIRPIIVGMTVVAFATSMPEFMVSLSAAIKGSSDIAAGNIIGSNIANIGLILGISALLFSIPVAKATLTREVPFMIFASGLLYFFCLDGQLDFSNGLILFCCLLIFLIYCLLSVRKHAALRFADGKEEALGTVRIGDFLRIGGGIVGLGFGAELMVRSAVTIARAMGITELVIGMTVVALGTSLPELAASLVSAWKGETEISIGNVIGSNIFNILFVLGLCPMIHPIAVDSAILRFEFPVMILFSVALVPLVLPKYSISRIKGLILLGGYVLFIGILFI
ncbi:MAG: calcium/sodium antiporter [Deltaproteobacteria bacterium]|nr:calcium/sodium antiporter [Deltaproteobacteria bacterium]